MKKLSRWAKNNPWLARIVIAISHLLVILNAVFIGFMLFVFDWETPEWILLLVAIFFCVLYLFYPKKGHENTYWGYSYRRQKIHDFGLVLTYAAVFALWINNFGAQQDYYHNTAPPAASAKFMVLKPNAPITTAEQDGWFANAKEKFRSSKKELRRELRALKKEWKKSGKAEGDGVKVLLILLTVLIALFLAVLVAALACSISCSGNEGLGGVVAILGLVGIVVLGVVVIKKIVEKEPRGVSRLNL